MEDDRSKDVARIVALLEAAQKHLERVGPVDPERVAEHMLAMARLDNAAADLLMASNEVERQAALGRAVALLIHEPSIRR